MRYFTPQQPLYSPIRSFAILEEPAAVFNKRVLVPDSYPAALISFGAPLLWETDRGDVVELPRAFFVRAQTKVLKIRASGFCHAIGLNLFTWGSRFLVSDAADLASCPIIPLDGKWLDLSFLLEHTLRSAGESEALATLLQFVNERPRWSEPEIGTFRAAIELLYATDGQTSVSDLADHCHLSPSQLERRSRYLTGLSPKMLARLIRFDAACAGLLYHGDMRLTDLAHKFGYADQAHFVHEFKTFASLTPSQARIYVRQLAQDAEFLQFS